MFTIIVCSIHPADAERLRANIEKTIGVPFEFLVYDNRETGKGICQVYNECAEKAQYDYLCFAHEDIEFMTEGWGRKLAVKLQEEDCGVIGFAGNAMKSKFPAGWCSTPHYGTRMNMVQGGKTDRSYKVNPYKEDFSTVVTSDGLCLFTPKCTWNKIRFDEHTLTGFHCYDIDFAIAAHVAGFKNYVCHTVLVKHFSHGNYDIRWWNENIKLHKKWSKHLPLYINKSKSALYRRYIEHKTAVNWVWMFGKNGLFDSIKKRHIAEYIVTHPLNGRSYKLLTKYLKYRRSRNTTNK